MKKNVHVKTFWYTLSDLLVGNTPNTRRCSRIFKPAFFLLVVFSLPATDLQAQWVQTGQDIDGEVANDHSGYSVSLSSDGSTAAIGAPYNSGSSPSAGKVRVYKLVSGVWTKLGADIDGEAEYNQSGYSVSLSADGSSVAIGAPYNSGSGAYSGQVRVYKLVSGVWTKQGDDIDGEAANDNSGQAVSLSSDGSTVAIGAPYNSGSSPYTGQVRVYKLVSGVWTKQGADIDGEAAYDQSGYSVSLSSDGSSVAIGAPYTYNGGNGSYSGKVRVYKLVSGVWTKQGADIDGEAAYDQSGQAVSLSSDGSSVAIGAPYNSSSSQYTGQVRVYKLVSGVWTKQGSDIDGEAAYDQSGYSVSLSSDGSSVAIGAPYSNSGTYGGLVRVYKLISGIWIKQAADIGGEAAYDQSGYSVSLSSDGSSVAIGAPYNSGSSPSAGQVRVYTLIPCTTPTVYSVTGPGVICPGTSADIGLSGSQSGHTYQLQRNGTNTGSPVNGTGGALTFQATQTGTYTVVATSPAGGICTALMSGSAVLAETVPPTITCADPVTIITTAGQCTVTTTLDLPTTSDNCPTGNALHFDGSNDVVRVADNNLLDLNFPLTLEAWFYQTGASFANIIVDKRTADDSNLGYGIWLNDGKPAFYLDNNGNTSGGHVIHVSPNAVSTNTWHHMAAVYDGARVKIYVDGVLSYDQPETHAITPTSERLSIGDRNQGGQAFAGRLEEVRIWNVARTLSEIQTNMNVELNAQSGLVAVYHFNEGVVESSNAGITTAPDASGNNLNGTLNNFLLSGSTSNWISGYLNSTPGLTNNAPATYPKGITTVTWTATDFSGNTATCQQTVTVTSNELPTISCPGSPLEHNLDPGMCTYIAQGTELDPLSYDDNCPGATISNNINSAATLAGAEFSAGQHLINWTVTDASGLNSTGCEVLLIVTATDNEPPTITCPANQTVPHTQSNPCSAVVNGIDGNYNDNCPGSSSLAYELSGATTGSGSGQASGQTFLSGTTTVTYTVTDGASLNSSCEFTVTVTNCNLEFSGRIEWSDDQTTGVNNATVSLTGSGTGNDLSDVNGDYLISLPYLTGNFNLTPVKNTNKLNGVTAADVIAIQQHVANAALITDPYRQVAADVNKTNSITSLDASIVNQALLGSPSGLAQFKTSWRFVPQSYTLPLPPWGFPEKIALTGVTSSQTGKDFYGIKTGDIVAAFANPANLGAGEPLVLRVKDEALEAGSELTVAFRTNEMNDLAAWQFALQFDPSQLQLLDIQPLPALPLTADHFGTFQVAQGEIRSVWAQAAGAALEDASEVFNLRFKVLQSGGKLSEALELADDILPGYVYTSALAESGIELEFYELTGTGPAPGVGNYRLLQNTPNPFAGKTNIGFVLPRACDATLRVFDGTGRLLREHSAWFAAGRNAVEFDFGGYPAANGLLYYELTTPFGVLAKKMVLAGK